MIARWSVDSQVDAHTHTFSPQNQKIQNCFEIENLDIKPDPTPPSILGPNCKLFLNLSLARPLPSYLGQCPYFYKFFFIDGIIKQQNLAYLIPPLPS